MPLNIQRKREPEKVCECAACGTDLLVGYEVIRDCWTGVRFCDTPCAFHFIRQNPDVYERTNGVPDLEIETLVEPDHEDRYPEYYDGWEDD